VWQSKMRIRQKHTVYISEKACRGVHSSVSCSPFWLPDVGPWIKRIDSTPRRRQHRSTRRVRSEHVPWRRKTWRWPAGESASAAACGSRISKLASTKTREPLLSVRR
jgi:hypothetical protein